MIRGEDIDFILGFLNEKMTPTWGSQILLVIITTVISVIITLIFTFLGVQLKNQFVKITTNRRERKHKSLVYQEKQLLKRIKKVAKKEKEEDIVHQIKPTGMSLDEYLKYYSNDKLKEGIQNKKLKKLLQEYAEPNKSKRLEAYYEKNPEARAKAEALDKSAAETRARVDKAMKELHDRVTSRF